MNSRRLLERFERYGDRMVLTVEECASMALVDHCPVIVSVSKTLSDPE
jgi:hypothetical protein